MPGTDAARKSQHARQLDVNLFSDVKKISLRDRNLTSEKIFTCYRPDPGPEGPGTARPATPLAKRHWDRGSGVPRTVPQFSCLIISRRVRRIPGRLRLRLFTCLN